jgi:hypothetical protein
MQHNKDMQMTNNKKLISVPSAGGSSKPHVSGRRLIVNDATDLIVGKMYNVTCAEIKNNFNHITFAFVPVIGEKHKDPQFGFDLEHIHIDGRFATEKDYLSVDKDGKTNSVLIFKKDQGTMNYVHQIVIKRRKCRRLSTGLKPPPQAERYNNWYDSMVGKSCAGKKCPHLGTTMREENGQLICPLHNLKGCPTSEVIVCR